MSDPAEAASQPARERDRSTKGRRAARPEKFDRERRIVNYLNAGVSVVEIAEREGVTHRRMRALVQEIFARRAPAPPAEFLAMQVGRLSEALLVPYSAMSPHNPQAVDRYVRIVRELDRYHGFTALRAPAHSGPPASGGARKDLAPAAGAGCGPGWRKRPGLRTGVKGGLRIGERLYP